MPLQTDETDQDEMPSIDLPEQNIDVSGQGGSMRGPTPSPGLAASQAPKQNLSDLMVTKDDLQNAADAKKNAAFLSFLSNNLSNRQSVGNFASGHMAPKIDSSGLYQAMADQANQPIEQKQMLQAQALKQPQIDYMAKASDPNSDLSKFSQQANVAQLQKVKASLFANNPQGQGAVDQLISAIPGKSSYEIDQLMDKTGMSKLLGSEAMSSDKIASALLLGQAHLAQGQQRLDQGQTRINMAKDNQAAGAAASFDKDPVMVGLTKQQQQIQRDMHTLDTAKTITPEIFNEVQLGVANAIAGGKAAAVSTQSKTEFNSLELDWTKLQQRLQNQPQDIGSPEVKQYVHDILDRLNAGYQKNMGERAQALSIGRNYSANPAAQSAIQQKMQSFQPKADSESSAPQSSPVPGVQQSEMQQALDWAKDHPKDPRAARILLKLNQQVGAR